MSSSLWEINLLGPLCAQREGRTVTRFKTRKTGALLGLMAARPQRPHRREEVIALLWPEAEEESGRNRLRHALVDLRQQLDVSDEEAGRVVVADRLQVQLSAGAFTTDKARFEALLETARKTLDDAQHIDLLTQAVELYRGDLLDGFNEDWIVGERQQMADAYLLALRRLIKALASGRQYERALHYARRAVEADPLREEAHRSLMQLYAGMGRPAEAMRQFRQMERLLREELNVAPSSQSQQLHSQLLPSGEPPVQIAHLLPSPALPSSDASLVSSPDRVPSSPAVTPNALPTYGTSLRGRERDVEQVCEMLLTPDTRLVSLTGLGGCGKTRVGVQAVQSLREAFAGRIVFVPLAAVQNASLLWDTLAQALRLPSVEPGGSREAQTLTALEGSPTLLLLDNAEHLGEVGSLWIADLLERAPAVSCLVTSRQRLNVSREYEYGLLPLPLPVPAAAIPELLVCPSVQVFLDRARRVRPAFAVTPANAEAVAAVCRTLEGLPLALELAAAWSQTLTPAQIQEKLAQRFTFLVSRTRDVSARHRSLQAVLEDSFQMLSPAVQRFFTRLSVFRGGWTLDAAQAVCEEPAALEYLTQLGEQSLLSACEDGAQMRYGWLETVREYAGERLAQEKRADLQQRHADFYRELAEEMRPRLVGAEAVGTLATLDTEQGNLRTALSWGMAHPPDGARLATSLAGFWYVRGHFREASRWLAQALETEEALPIDVRLHTTGSAGNFAYLQTDYQTAHVHFTTCLTMARQTGDLHDTAHALDSLGNVTLERGNHDQARGLLEESIQMWRDLGEPRYLAMALSHRAILAEDLGELELARSLYEESLDLYRCVGKQSGIGLMLSSLSGVLLKSGEYAAVAPMLEESLTLSRQISSARNEAVALGQMAHMNVLQSRFESAAALLREAVQVRDKAGICLSPKTIADWKDMDARIVKALGSPGDHALCM